MHLIVIIAIGVFAGLWLFVKWEEWRQAHAVRKLERQIRDSAQRATAAPAPPLGGPSVGLAVTSAAVLLVVLLSL